MKNTDYQSVIITLTFHQGLSTDINQIAILRCGDKPQKNSNSTVTKQILQVQAPTYVCTGASHRHMASAHHTN